MSEVRGVVADRELRRTRDRPDGVLDIDVEPVGRERQAGHECRLVDGADGPGLGALRLKIFVAPRSEEHTSELQSLMRISYAVFCLKKTKKHKTLSLEDN